MKDFLIYKAAAGSGKTFTLVKHFIELSCQHDSDKDFSHILAITFTNKAANEMKQRVLKELGAIVEQEESDMGKTIAGELKIDYKELQRRAMKARGAILHNYSELSIQTIDSFTNHVVRSFANDLNLPMNFELQTDTENLTQQITDLLIATVGTEDDKGLRELLCHYATHNMEEGKSNKIEKNIYALAQTIFDEEAPERLEKLSEIDARSCIEVVKKSNAADQKMYEKLKEEGKRCLTLFRDNGLSEDDLYQKKRGIYGYMEKMAAGRYTDKPTAYVEKFFEKPGKAEAIVGEVREAYNTICSILEKELPKHNTRKIVKQNIYVLALLNRLREIANEWVYDNNEMHISELTKRISEVIAESDTPFIYERIGTRYRHYLIDEFQDTSQQQWANLVPLLSEGLSTAGQTSLVVGDAKQAIYRFRGGDVEQFIQLPKVTDNRHSQQLEARAKTVPLDTNFRSHAKIVKFNNRFYKALIERIAKPEDELWKAYIGADKEKPTLRQTPNTKKKEGYVEISFHSPADDDKNQALWEKARDIVRRETREHGYRYSDIAIIARKKGTLNDAANYLASNPIDGEAIPMISAESFLIKNSRAVRLICATLRHLTDSGDLGAMVAMAELMGQLGLTEKIGAEELKGVKEFKLIDKRGATEDMPTFDTYMANIRSGYDSEKLRVLTLYDCCEEIVRQLGLQEIEVAYTTTFLGHVASYSQRHGSDKEAFLQWYDKQDFSTQSLGGSDAVNLLTIHKSKGLEYPIVIYIVPDQAEHDNELWVDIDAEEYGVSTVPVKDSTKDTDREMDEQIQAEAAKKRIDTVNLLYVATTRPEDKLFIICGKSKDKDGPTKAPHGQYLYQTMQEADWMERSDDDTYCYGCDWDIERTQQTEASVAGYTLTANDFGSWTEHIAIAPIAREESEQVRHGTQIHDLLSHITTEADIERAIARHIKSHREAESEAEALKKELIQIVTAEPFKAFFSQEDKTLNECELLYQGGTLRPDRIIFKDGETWVVDFKTGQPLDKHTKQVTEYCKAVAEMGYPNVKGYLLYTQTRESVAVC